MSFQGVPWWQYGVLRWRRASAVSCVLMLAVFSGWILVPPAHAAASSVTVFGSPNPATVHEAVLLQAVVTCAGAGGPTGSVSFVDSTTGRALGTDTAGTDDPQAGQRRFLRLATFDTVSVHTIIATFTSTNPACDSASGSTTVTVIEPPSFTGVSASPNPATVNQDVLLTATVTCPSGPIIPGDVTFIDTTTGALIGRAGFSRFGVPRFAGQADLTTSFSAPGAHVVTATFSGSGSCGPSSGSVTVTVAPLNVGALQFGAPTFSVSEAGATAAISVTRTGSTVGAVGATVTLSDGTATAPADYDNTPRTVSFADGEGGSKTVSVPIVNDAVAEPDETVHLTLASPTGGATLGSPTVAVLTITESPLVPPPVVPSPPPPTEEQHEKDDKKKETQQQRHQRQHTNAGNRDDVYTEGNVVEVHQDEQPPSVVIANRDGLVTIQLRCGSQCPTIRVGDYLEADGDKISETLFIATDVEIAR